jgi:hypothetical protein
MSCVTWAQLRLTIINLYLKSRILSKFVFLHFPILAFKLEYLLHKKNAFAIKRPSIEAKKEKYCVINFLIWLQIFFSICYKFSSLNVKIVRVKKILGRIWLLGQPCSKEPELRETTLTLWGSLGTGANLIKLIGAYLGS